MSTVIRSEGLALCPLVIVRRLVRIAERPASLLRVVIRMLKILVDAVMLLNLLLLLVIRLVTNALRFKLLLAGLLSMPICLVMLTLVDVLILALIIVIAMLDLVLAVGVLTALWKAPPLLSLVIVAGIVPKCTVRLGMMKELRGVAIDLGRLIIRVRVTLKARMI